MRHLGACEMPTLNWIGKRAVINHHREVPYHLLRCDESLSVGDPGSGNLLVQCDNLLALKALLPYYAGQVKCVYIDPRKRAQLAVIAREGAEAQRKTQFRALIDGACKDREEARNDIVARVTAEWQPKGYSRTNPPPFTDASNAVTPHANKLELDRLRAKAAPRTRHRQGRPVFRPPHAPQGTQVERPHAGHEGRRGSVRGTHQNALETETP